MKKTRGLGFAATVGSCEDIKNELLYACRHASTNSPGFSAHLNSFPKRSCFILGTDLVDHDRRWQSRCLPGAAFRIIPGLNPFEQTP